MAYLNVRVLSSGGNPVSGKKVTIFIKHNFMPQTWLEDYTDGDGRVSFDFDGYSIDVHVDGTRQMSGVGTNREVTVSI
jgi:hypothetical protein